MISLNFQQFYEAGHKGYKSAIFDKLFQVGGPRIRKYFSKNSP